MPLVRGRGRRLAGALRGGAFLFEEVLLAELGRGVSVLRGRRWWLAFLEIDVELLEVALLARVGPAGIARERIVGERDLRLLHLVDVDRELGPWLGRRAVRSRLFLGLGGRRGARSGR